MHVVATAGHVDHGKSTLVEALTGQRPDRLAEEQRRGLSITLGYCWTDLEDAGRVAFVDVPGHERFLATALSGLGPVPAVLFVVAADDPWMPQAAEHLAALDALGVRHGVLVVTRSDLADPAPALARARDAVAATSLAGAEAVCVSGRTGEGLLQLRAALATMLREVPPPDPAADVRLWVDRRFTVKGAGTVVTGTLPAGSVSTGDHLESDGVPVRVRGLEQLGEPVTTATGPARVALQLAGPVPESLGRGSALVTVGAFERVHVVDVAVRGPDGLPERPLLHVGSTQQSVHARPLGATHARLTLTGALPLRHGDRAILRDPGSRALWGVEVLDAAPPPLRGRGSAARRTTRLATWDPGLAAEVERRGVVRRDLLRRLGVTGAPGGVRRHGDWLVSPGVVDGWREALTLLAQQPGGVTEAEAAHRLGLPDPRLLDLATPDGVVRRQGRLLADDSAPPELRQALDVVTADLTETPFRAPDTERLAALGLDAAAITILTRAGSLLHLGGGVVLLPGADDEAARRLAALPQPFTTSEARQALDTSRRVVLPLLAHLDRTGRTVRLPDDRRRVR